jgi:hypothetical protein
MGLGKIANDLSACDRGDKPDKNAATALRQFHAHCAPARGRTAASVRMQLWRTRHRQPHLRGPGEAPGNRSRFPCRMAWSQAALDLPALAALRGQPVVALAMPRSRHVAPETVRRLQAARRHKDKGRSWRCPARCSSSWHSRRRGASTTKLWPAGPTSRSTNPGAGRLPLKTSVFG